MARTQNEIVEHLYIIPGLVNIYILDLPGGLTLIDTGFERDTQKILQAIRAVGKAPEDLKHILLTHAHPDHVGGAAALKKLTGARIYAHGIDAPLIETGGPPRPMQAAPGIRNMIFFRLLRMMPSRFSPVKVDSLLQDGVPVPFDGNLVPIHVPGHCAGQLAFRWNKGGGVLFAADACINRNGMVLAAAQEDINEARRSLVTLASLDFETACFGHGPPIVSEAARGFKERWL